MFRAKRRLAARLNFTYYSSRYNLCSRPQSAQSERPLEAGDPTAAAAAVLLSQVAAVAVGLRSVLVRAPFT